MKLSSTQKVAFGKLFNAKHYKHYGDSEWVTSRQIGVRRNTLESLVRLGLVEYKYNPNVWYEINSHLFRLK